MDKVKPLVSISCITFNHVDYIKNALDGFINQKTTFDFEVLIHDDASTDGTEEIIREYEKKYPDIIKPLYEETNQWVKGRKGSVLFNFPRAQGKYIALCEGDDYWVDPNKLQKQVDLMEANEECKICYTRVNVNLEGQLISDEKDATEIRYNKIKDKSRLDITTLLEHGNFIHTCSILFRNQDLKFPFEMHSSPIGDYLIYIVLTKNGGTIKKIEDITAVYRRGIGVYSSLNKELMLQKKLTYLTCILSLIEKEAHRKIMLARVIKIQRRLFKADTNPLSFKQLLHLMLHKFKNKLT